MLYIFGFLPLLLALYYSPYLFRLLQQRGLAAACRAQHALVLTYDDGPHCVTTLSLLDILSEQHAKATFFVIGQRVVLSPDVLIRLRTEGHEIGSHSDRHLHAWRVWPWASTCDVHRGFVVLEKLGVNVRLFRPPYGKMNLFTWIALLRRRIAVGWWTVVSGDTDRPLPDPREVVRAVTRAGGGVVLIHDYAPERDRLEFVLTLTRQLIVAAKENRWSIMTLSDLYSRRQRARCDSAVAG